MQDKLWFFTGVQYFKHLDRPAGFIGAFTSEKDPRYIGKINWAASPNVKVEGFYEWDKYDITGRERRSGPAAGNDGDRACA